MRSRLYLRLFRFEVPLEHPLVRRALEDSVDRVVVADRRRDGLGTVDHDLRGVRVPEGRHQPGTLGLGPAQTLDAVTFWRCNFVKPTEMSDGRRIDAQ